MKLPHRFTGSLLIAALSFSPLAALAAEGKKGLNAVNVKVVRMAGDPIPDIDITLDQYPPPTPGGREMVMPGDIVDVPTEKERGAGQDSDGNGGLDRLINILKSNPNGTTVVNILNEQIALMRSMH